MLLGLQQQLLVQLESIELAIIKAESEERIAKLASQQAHVLRLLSSGGKVGNDNNNNTNNPDRN